MKAKGKKKQLDFTVRPRMAKDELPAADEWVREGQGATGPQKRLTLNLPAALHTAFKSRCVLEAVTIQDKVQALIEAELTKASPQPSPTDEPRPLSD